MLCHCDCVNCENGDHEHCEHECQPIEDDEDLEPDDPDPDGAIAMWNER